MIEEKIYFELPETKEICNHEAILSDIKNSYKISTNTIKNGLSKIDINQAFKHRYYKIRSGEFKNKSLEEKIKKIYKSEELLYQIKKQLNSFEIEENNEENNKFIINYYYSKEYIAPHMDNHDIVVIILLDCDHKVDNHLRVADNPTKNQGIIEDFKNYEKYLQGNNNNDEVKYEANLNKLEENLKSKSSIIELEILKPIVLLGGKYLHFTTPARYNRTLLVLNYNLKKIE